MKPVIRCLAALAGALALSCSSNTPYYRVEITAPDTVTLLRGETMPLELTVTRVGQVAGEVRLNLQSAPEGITLDPEVVLPEGQETITATTNLAVAADSTAEGAYNSLLLAQDPSNDFAAAARFYLVVLPPPVPNSDFSVALATRQVNLFAGQRSELEVTVTRAEGFTGPVEVTLQAPTIRITADPLTIPEGATTGTLNIHTDPGATRIPVALGVTGAADATRKATTAFTLNLR